MPLQRESVSKELYVFIYLLLFQRQNWREEKDFVLHFVCASLTHFYKREPEGEVRGLASGKGSTLIQVSSEKTVEQRVLVVLMWKR